MIIAWYRVPSNEPTKTSTIRDTAEDKPSDLPSPFVVEGVAYGRHVGEEVDRTLIGVRITTPSENISDSAIEAIADAFSQHFGGVYEIVDVETV